MQNLYIVFYLASRSRYGYVFSEFDARKALPSPSLINLSFVAFINKILYSIFITIHVHESITIVLQIISVRINLTFKFAKSHFRIPNYCNLGLSRNTRPFINIKVQTYIQGPGHLTLCYIRNQTETLNGRKILYV